MNIFKVLASGDGTINEPNISSFFAYLIDPSAGHGLSARLLQAFLDPLIDSSGDKLKELKDIDGVIRGGDNWDIWVKTELRVLVPGKQKSRDIDIVIEFFESDKLRYAICVENKIKKGSEQKNQLEEELNGLINAYQEQGDNPMIGLIYITKDYDSNCKLIFEEDTSDMEVPHIHMVWVSKLDNPADKNRTIYNLISDILEKESKGLIDPIFDYTKHTIKAFLSFTESGFRAFSVQKQVTEGKWAKTIYRSWSEFEAKLNNRKYITLAKNIHDIFLTEYCFEPHYSPSGISFSIPGSKNITGTRMFTGIAIQKNSLKIGLQKNPDMNFDEFKEFIRTKIPGIEIVPPPPSYQAGFNIAITSIEEFNKYVRPLIPIVKDYLLEKS